MHLIQKKAPKKTEVSRADTLVLSYMLSSVFKDSNIKATLWKGHIVKEGAKYTVPITWLLRMACHSQLRISSPCSFPFILLLLLKSTSWFTSEVPCLYSCLPLTPIYATRLHSEFTRPFFNSQMTAKPWKQFFLKQIYVVYSFLRPEVQIPLSS